MKKMMKMLLVAAMSFTLLGLSACGSDSDSTTQTPTTTEREQETETEIVLEPNDIGSDVAKASEGVLELKMSDVKIIMNGKSIARPFAFGEIVAAGIQNADTLSEIELFPDEFYSAYAFLDEMEDYVVIPSYYNGTEEALPIAEAEADGIGMVSYAEYPEDQNVSILGVKFGMTKAEVIDILGEPSWKDGTYYEWIVAMDDSDYEGYFTIYFNSDADDAVVSQADLDITDYGF